MFTGIVEATGPVLAVRVTPQGRRAVVQVPDDWEDVRPGDSIAVDGCCLTVVEREGAHLSFDLVPETLSRTTFGSLAPGRRVNLERSLRVGDRLGGHFVTGHVDAVGTVRALVRRGEALEMELEAPPSVRGYLVEKGSVAVDGVSLTIASVGERGFRVALVPHTLAVTTLGLRGEGDPVHLEADLLVKAVARLLATGRIASPIDPADLAAGGERPQAGEC